MTDYRDIPDSEIESEKPVTNTLMTALRDNATAISEGSTGAPKIQSAAIDSQVVTTSKIADNAVTVEKNALYSNSRQYVSGDNFMISAPMVTITSRANSYLNTGCYVECKYDGSLTLILAGKSDSSSDAKARVRKNDSTTLATFTVGGTSLSDYEVSFSVNAGDFIMLQIGDDNSNATFTLNTEDSSGRPTGFYISRLT